MVPRSSFLPYRRHRSLPLCTASRATLLILGIGLLAACGGGGSDVPERDRSGSVSDSGRFARFGAQILFQRDDEIRAPVIAVFGLLGMTDVPGVITEEIRCRDGADAVIAFSIADDGSYIDAERSTASLAQLFDELRDSGVQSITVVGHHLGGVIARAALLRPPATASSPPIRLITVYAPFAGVPASEMKAIYPANFAPASSFIAEQGPLPAFVSQQKYEIAETPPLRAISDLGEDRLFFDAQSTAAVDTDPALTVRERREQLPWPFSVTTLLRTIFERSGFGQNSCRPPLIAQPVAIATAASLLGRIAPKEGESDGGRIPFDREELARSGVQAPALDGSFEPTKPTVVLTHGVGASATDLDRLEAALAKDYNVFRFIYDEHANTNPDFADIAESFSDETDDLEEISERQGDAIRKVHELTGQEVIYQVGYSLGGVIARHPLTTDGPGSIADEGFSSALVTVASPYGGSFAANFNPTFWFSALTPIPGTFFGRLASTSDYISEPGIIAPDNLHFPIKSLEDGRTFNGKDDEQLSLEDQANDTVDQDPNNVTTSFPNGSFQLVGGHLEIVNDPNTIVVIKAALDFLRRKKEGLPDPDVQPTPLASPSSENESSGGGDGSGAGASGDDGTDGSSSDGDEDSGPRFGCRSGHYSPFGNSSCGLADFELAVGNGFVRVNPFGINGSVSFDVDRANTAQADGLDILGGDQHTCSLLCTDRSGLLLAVRCTNPRGGRCAQGYSGVSRD